MLLNRARTQIRFSRRVKVDLAKLLVQMEEANVPLQYTNGLKEVYFTFLRGLYGCYLDDRVMISCDQHGRECMDRTFIHELAHHLDEEEDISERPGMLEEKKKSHKVLGDKHARDSVSEYVAIGFEVYYFGTKIQRKKMQRKCPRLWKTIRYIHRKYRSR